MELTNRVVIVTGSSSGIGQATALRFANAGARVVINCKKNITGANEVVATIIAQGGQAVAIQADLGDKQQVEQLFEKTIATFGQVDVLINNAGGYLSQDFLTASKESWMQVFDDNLFSAIYCSQVAAKLMLAQGHGKILNMSSVYGHEHTGDPTGMAYSVAKAGIISLTKNLAKLWSPTILVNAVAPGYTHIPRFDTYPADTQAAMKSEMRLNRWVTPEEIAEAFLFLAQNDAITGEILTVDGGFRLK